MQWPDSSLIILKKILSKEIVLKTYENKEDDIKSGKWSPDEDDILRAIVLINGDKNWKKISHFIKRRTPI